MLDIKHYGPAHTTITRLSAAWPASLLTVWLPPSINVQLTTQSRKFSALYLTFNLSTQK